MKTLFTLTAALLLSFASIAQDYSGNWRGILSFAPEYRIVLGFELTQTEQGYKLALLSPNQTMQPLEPTSYKIDGDTLSFSDDKLKASFSGRFEGDTLTGTFSQRQDVQLTLTRLTEQDLNRLKHEQQWAGDLKISADASLPLVLNVAVIAGGYNVTLDSPKQQSFGIPVDQFSVSADSLQFGSKLINASYQGTWQQDQWQGTFVQGMAMPLNLKKKH